VCGTFEIEDGKILVWRDYFSNRAFLWGTLKGLVRMF
jgi:limonene-1,2-epoxide hydrolase